MTDLIGYLAGILLTLCFLPQIFKTYQLKQADEVSMLMLLLSLASAIFYEVYSWLLELWPVFIMNGIFSLLVAVEIWLKIYYDRQVIDQTDRPNL
jgi:MtN3 and saliva related transmembrane protein